ncbi:AfsR/SARP family transcriptional regulator [Micromonospora sp. CA-240977]|uniref:AfsR/SARP family transcriptional regulator n=1 Tax=Micromonospora sp. CA-240977 TaxID=3239957 RepID=UPI003D8B7033
MTGENSNDLRFALLGPVRAWRGSTELSLGAKHPRLILALLLARTGGLAEVPELVDLLWRDEPPPTAVNMVHRYVGMLRRVLEPDLPARSGGRWLLRDVGGYRLVSAGSDSDLVAFRRWTTEARRLAETGEDMVALKQFVAALSLWHGRCAAGLGPAVASHPDFVAIEREHITAVRDAATAALRLGEATLILPFIEDAAVRNPLDEALQAQLLLLLAASGNHSEAISRYGHIRTQLADELGVDPGPTLQTAYLGILNQGREPAAVNELPAEAPRAAVAVQPAQLPSDLPVFVGRADLIDEGLTLLSGNHSAVPILAFDGMPGVGKTTLAIHLAHRLAARFPEGQLYADLRGFDPVGRIAEPADILQNFLSALGVSPEGIPASLDGRAALFRSAVASRRLLIVLDNARDVEQVRPLLPGTALNAVLVTSRSRLGGLATSFGANLRSLDVLSEQEARDCFTERVGPVRASAEPEALDHIIQRCGRLPLALAVVAARVAALDDQSLRDIATDLWSGGQRLDAFSDDGLDHDVRDVFTWSYRLLNAGAARMLRLLPLHPGADITAEVAASLAGIPRAEARSHLGALVRTRLLNRYRPNRYRLHDLVRAFAAELGDTHLTPGEQDEARLRIEDHYLHTTYAAVRRFRPGFAEVEVGPPHAGVTPEELTDRFDASAWFADEHVTIREIIAYAGQRADVRTCWKLALLAKDVYQQSGLWRDWSITAGMAVEAATRASDITGLAQSHRSLAGARHFLGDDEGRSHHLEIAADLFQQSDDAIGRAEVLMNLGWVAQTQGDHNTAIALLHEALDVFVDKGMLEHETNVLTMIAEHHLITGDLERSWATAMVAARKGRERGDVRHEDRAMTTISRILSQRGHFAAAVSLGMYYVEAHLREGQVHNAAMCLIDVGQTLQAAGEVADAYRLWERATSISDDEILSRWRKSRLSSELAP